MVSDLLAETGKRIESCRPECANDIRHAGRPVVAFSAEMEACSQTLRDFLFVRVYRHYQVNRETSKARRVVRDLFALFVAEPNTPPPGWQGGAPVANPQGRARMVGGHLPGQTTHQDDRERL